jgi:hypothetical protein
MEEIKDKYKKVFDAYLRLQAETYELLLRNVMIDQWLVQAYEPLKEMPKLSPEEIYNRLKDKFEGVYQDLFSMFFRPLRVLVNPYREFLKVHSEVYGSQFWFERYMDLFRGWGEMQANFLRGIAGTYQGYLETEKGREENAAAQAKELRPLELLRKICDEESRLYFEALGKLIEYTGETQFLFPKTFFIYLRNGVNGYAKMHSLWGRYELMLHHTWEKSLAKFSVGLAKNGKLPAETGYKEFYKMFVDTFSGEYSELLKSNEFIEAQNEAMNILADLHYNSEKALEAQLDMFPVLPFAPRSEIEVMEKRIYDCGRGIKKLEKEIRGMKEQLKIIPPSEELSRLEEKMSGEEMAELKKKIEEMENEMKRLSRKKGPSRKAGKEAGEG